MREHAEIRLLCLLKTLAVCVFVQSKQGASRALILNKSDVQLKILLAHLRLAHATRCLNDAGFAELAEACVEIGKMLGGWIKTTKAHESES